MWGDREGVVYVVNVRVWCMDRWVMGQSFFVLVGFGGIKKTQTNKQLNKQTNNKV